MADADDEKAAFALQTGGLSVAEKISKRTSHPNAIGRSKLGTVHGHPPNPALVRFDGQSLTRNPNPEHSLRQRLAVKLRSI